MREQSLLRCIQAGVADLNTRLFRANSGAAWQGRSVNLAPGQVYRAAGAALVLEQPRRVDLFPTGTADLVGLTPVIIMPEHIGLQLAVFTAIEVKTPSGRLSEPQKRFLQMCNDLGALSGVARSVEEARRIIRP